MTLKIFIGLTAGAAIGYGLNLISTHIGST